MHILFNGADLNPWLNKRRAAAIEAIRKVPEEIRSDPDGLADRVATAFGLDELEVNWASKYTDPPRDWKYDVADFGRIVKMVGQEFSIHVPYSGDQALLDVKPSTRQMGYILEADTGGGELVFDVRIATPSVPEFEREIQSRQSYVDSQIGYVNAEVRTWRSNLRDVLASSIATEKARLEATEAMLGAISIPVGRVDAHQRIEIPAKRKTVKPTERVPVSQKLGKPSDAEYVLEDSVYQDVLSMLRHVGNSMERLPNTIAKFEEEELRDILLFILNSNYAGSAGGELFNGDGKTDVLVRWNDRNAFIGECKVWHGDKLFTQAIDQMLGYLVWRDTKAALILFIRNKDVGAVIEKADAAIRAHPNFVSAKESSEPSLRRDYLLHPDGDESQLITTALLPIPIREPSGLP